MGVLYTQPMHCKLLLKPPVTDYITHLCNDYAVLYSSKKNDCIPVYTYQEWSVECLAFRLSATVVRDMLLESI